MRPTRIVQQQLIDFVGRKPKNLTVQETDAARFTAVKRHDLGAIEARQYERRVSGNDPLNARQCFSIVGQATEVKRETSWRCYFSAVR